MGQSSPNRNIGTLSMSKPIKKTVLLSILMLSASACVSTPDEALAPIDVPLTWTASQKIAQETNATALPLNWLTDLNDPALATLITEALNHNKNLGVAAKRVEIARQTTGVTRSILLPSVGINANRTESIGVTQQLVGNEEVTVPIDRTDYAGGYQASWEIDLWGSNLDSTRAAYQDLKASEADFIAARLSIAGTVANSWYTLVSARLQRELAERDVESGHANLSITERRYARGVSSSLDVRLARSSSAQSEATLISRQQAEQEAKRALEVLLGRYPSAELEVADKLPTLKSITNADGLITGLGSPASLLDQRPDLIAAAATLTAEGLRANAAKKALLPSLNLSFNASVANLSDFDSVLDFDDAFERLTASLVQPVFQGGRLRASAKRQKASAEAAVLTYAQTALQAFGEVENAIAAEEFLAAREIAQRLAFEEAVASEDLTRRQYVNGTTNIFNLINAQQRRISNEGLYISAAQARLVNRINLYMALGGTFAPSDGQEEAYLSEAIGKSQEKKIPLFKRWWLQGAQKEPQQNNNSETEAAL